MSNSRTKTTIAIAARVASLQTAEFGSSEQGEYAILRTKPDCSKHTQFKQPIKTICQCREKIRTSGKASSFHTELCTSTEQTSSHQLTESVLVSRSSDLQLFRFRVMSSLLSPFGNQIARGSMYTCSLRWESKLETRTFATGE